MSNPNESAFPVLDRSEYDDRNGLVTHEMAGGLTKREYFAGLAMQGLLAAPAEIQKAMIRAGEGISIASNKAHAAAAVEYADALLAALEPTP